MDKVRLFLILALLGINVCPLMAYEKEIKNLSQAMVEAIANKGTKTIAVVDFIDLQGNVTELGRFIGEELSVDLVTQAKGFEVIDRIHLKTILNEHKLSMSGLVDPKNVKKLGSLAGVDAIITGCVTPFGDSIRVSCKLITTDTAKVIAACKGDIAKTKAIEELMVRGIEKEVPGTETQVPTKQVEEPKALQKIEAKGFTFELKKCKMSGGSIVCDFLITSNNQDRSLQLVGNYYQHSSRMFDDFGNEYIATEAQLGNKSGKDYIESLLVAGVATKASLHFEGVSQEATKITLLEIGCKCPANGYDSDRFVAQFRNIPLSK